MIPAVSIEPTANPPIHVLSLWKGLIEVRPGASAATMGDIIAAVAERNGFTARQLEGPQRGRALVLARHEAMWLMYQTGQWTQTQIGRRLGDRDHTTVGSGIRAHARRAGIQP